MTAMEIERKFLITSLPAGFLDKHRGERIDQGYLILEDQTELRIRNRAGHCTMTLKQGRGLERLEQEKAIDKELFAMLWPLTVGRRIEKTRYVIDQSGHCLELDFFSGTLAPLVLLEVEFTSIDASHDFVPPAFVCKEVTNDRTYSNAMLATIGLAADIGRHSDQTDEDP